LLFLGDVIIIRLFLVVESLHIRFGGIEIGFVHAGGIGLEEAFFVVGVFEDVACGFALASRVERVHYLGEVFKILIYEKLY
jgi:hypothetical protein